MDRVTPEMEKAYVEWEAPADVELRMPRVLGLIRAAFYAGWKARDEKLTAPPATNTVVKCPECGHFYSRNRIDHHLASVHNIC